MHDGRRRELRREQARHRLEHGLGALAAKRTATLSFTGFQVWIVALIGFGLLTLGLALRRQSRVTT